MTKLEQKLIELGYEQGLRNTYHKRFTSMFILTFEVYSEVIFSRVDSQWSGFSCQEQIDTLQQAFNQLQSDLKELKEYELVF